MRKNVRKIVSLMLVFSFGVMLCNSPVYANNSKDISVLNYEDKSGETENKNPTLVIDGDLTYEFSITSEWSDGYNGEITIKNNGNETIESWALSFEFDSIIERCWSADIVLHEGNKYVMKGFDWNADINPGQILRIGFAGKLESVGAVPTKYNLVNQMVQCKDGYRVSFNVINDWGSAYNAEIIVENTGKEIIGDWVIEFDFDSKIERFYTAEIVSSDNNHYVVKNAGYNGEIKVGDKLILGFNGKPGNFRDTPTNVTLYKASLIRDDEVEENDCEEENGNEIVCPVYKTGDSAENTKMPQFNIQVPADNEVTIPIQVPYKGVLSVILFDIDENTKESYNDKTMNVGVYSDSECIELLTQKECNNFLGVFYQTINLNREGEYYLKCYSAFYMPQIFSFSSKLKEGTE